MRHSERAPIVLRTRRLDLRPLRPSDARWYLAHFSEPEIVHGSGFPAPADVRAASEELQTYVFDLIAQGTGMRWGIALRGHDELIGSIGYYGRSSEPIRKAEIGYDLAPEHWGQGLMTEALEALVRYCFKSLGLQRLEALVLPHNQRSVRLLERAGFRNEGLLPRHGTDEHGLLVDELLLSLVNQEHVSRAHQESGDDQTMS